MKVTRKQFLSTVATGVLGAAIAPGRLLGESGQAVQSIYSPEMFAPYVGSTFRVTSAELGQAFDEFDVTLQEVSRAAGGPETVQFSLEFTGPAGDAAASKTYVFRHPELGSLPMFVTPARKDAQARVVYRADFNILQNARSTVIVPPRRRR